MAVLHGCVFHSFKPLCQSLDSTARPDAIQLHFTAVLQYISPYYYLFMMCCDFIHILEQVDKHLCRSHSLMQGIRN